MGCDVLQVSRHRAVCRSWGRSLFWLPTARAGLRQWRCGRAASSGRGTPSLCPPSWPRRSRARWASSSAAAATSWTSPTWAMWRRPTCRLAPCALLACIGLPITTISLTETGTVCAACKELLHTAEKCWRLVQLYYTCVMTGLSVVMRPSACTQSQAAARDCTLCHYVHLQAGR